MPRRWTIEDLTTSSTKDLIVGLLNDRKDTLTNVYAPLYSELDKLIKWVQTNLPDTREHDRR